MTSSPRDILLSLCRIAGYTWYKTYRTIERLGIHKNSDPNRTLKWLEHKQSELNFASIIGGLLASAVTASLSWPNIHESHWLVRACWYVALSMVITSVLVAFQQVAGLGGMLATHSHLGLYHALVDAQGRPSWKTVFVLQVPVQLLSYSIFFYTLGLAVHVFYPLRLAWGNEAKIAVFYAVGLTASVALFMVGSHYSLQLLETDEAAVGEERFSRSATVVNLATMGEKVGESRECGGVAAKCKCACGCSVK